MTDPDGTPTRAASEVPAVDEAQMREVDRLMMDEVGIDLRRMMENAGRNMADVAIRRFAPRRVAVLHGGGGNGGGALCAARHLRNRGVDVATVASSDAMTPVPAEQAAILARMGVPALQDLPTDIDLVCDGMIGYSLRGAPRGRVAELIAAVADLAVPVLSLDVPSGFSAADGTLRDPHVRADATLTLALPKRGLVGCPAAGDVYLGDISVPAAVLARLGLAAPVDLFTRDQIIKLT